MSAEELLLEVSRCPNIDWCLSNPGVEHPCQEIVSYQAAKGLDSFQVPEPWNGDIVNSLILFLSSNPSISFDEVYPLRSWKDSELIDFFTFRFGQGQRQWTEHAKRPLLKDGSYGRAVKFWSSVKARATELLEREALPGIDYCIAEVVRCKSRDEVGVQSAKQECSDKYLLRTLNTTNARVIVVLGIHARLMIEEAFSLSNSRDKKFVSLEINGKQKIFAFLPHPNARGTRTFGKCFNPEELSKLRDAIAPEI